MTNLQLTKIEIPSGFRKLDDENIIKEDDKICHVAGKTLKVTWIEVDRNEIGLTKKQFGETSIIIRKIA